jgi:hypothetical protein
MEMLDARCGVMLDNKMYDAKCNARCNAKIYCMITLHILINAL